MARTAKKDLAKRRVHKISAAKADTLSSENHREIFARLSDPIFNEGAMHEKPQQRQKKAH